MVVMSLALAGCDAPAPGKDYRNPCDGWNVAVHNLNGFALYILKRQSPINATYIKFEGTEKAACEEANKKFGFSAGTPIEAERSAASGEELRAHSASSSAAPPPFAAFNQYALDVVIPDLGGVDKNYVAVVFERENAVTIIRTDGTNLLAPLKFPTGINPRVLRAGDVNRDGKVDLVTANSGTLTGEDYSGGDVSLLLGNGDGSFHPAISIVAGKVPRDVGLGDFNEDGKLDLVVANAPFTSTPSLVLRLGNGDGTFQPATVIETPAQSLAVVHLNVDIDHHEDIVTSGSILLGRGDGTFAPAQSLPLGFKANVNVVKVVDINGDRKPDVIVGSIDKELVSVFLGHGDGTLATPHHYRVYGSPEEIQISDQNEDGTADILVSNGIGGGARLLGNGDGTFQAAEIYFVVNNTLGASGAAVADFTGDGVPDLLVANGGYWQGQGSLTAVLMRGLGAGRFGSPVPLQEQLGLSVVAGDWNGDGRQDLAFTGDGDRKQQLSIALGHGDGTFSSATKIDLPGRREHVGNFLTTAFVNGDNTPDLLVANLDKSVSVFLGNGQGGFVAPPVVPIGVSPNGIVSGDLNGDGKLDMAVTYLGDFSALNGGLKIALGNGDGTFGSVQIVLANVAPDSVAIADFDGDGKLDLAVSLQVRKFEWDVEILLGNGDATFRAPIALGLSDNFVTGVAVADVDLDGKPDLAVSEGGSRALGLRGKGNGTFDLAVSTVIGGGRIIGDF